MTGKSGNEILGMVALLLLLAGCSPEPQPIAFGQDNCAHCLMTISDERYGAELVTKKGKVHKFDAVECLASYLVEGQVNPEDIHSVWVTDFKNPPLLIPASQAFYLQSENLRSPMGMNLTAFGNEADQDAVLDAYPGRILNWNQVLDSVRSEHVQPAGIPLDTN